MFHYSKMRLPFAKYGRLPSKGGRYDSALRIQAPNPPGTSTGRGRTNSRSCSAIPRTAQAAFSGSNGTRRSGAHSLSPPVRHHLRGHAAHREVRPAPAGCEGDALRRRAGRPGILPDDFLWELKKGVYRSPLIKHGRPETFYLGNWKAAKGAPDLRQGRRDAHSRPELTRIERVYKNSKLRLRDLAKLPNVFRTLSCHDAHAALAALGAKGSRRCIAARFTIPARSGAARRRSGDRQRSAAHEAGQGHRLICAGVLGSGRHLGWMAGCGRTGLLPRARRPRRKISDDGSQ